MKIGLIDVDGHNFPNLPLMKLSEYHKAKGDSVEWWCGLCTYDIVYKSKVFTFTPDIEYEPRADLVVEGGTGYDIKNKFPTEIENMMPDYSLYPKYQEAYGFLTRGCPRNCKFCCVTQKEGRCSKQVADLRDFWNGQRTVKLCDPNILACRDHELLLKQLSESGAWVDFTQGLDIRLMTDASIDLLNKIKVKMFHFAWDNPENNLIPQFQLFKSKSKVQDYRKLTVYVLTNFGSTHEEDLYRVYHLREMGYDPYIMIFDKGKYINPKTRKLRPLTDLQKIFTFEQIEHFKLCWALSRWVNNRPIFESCNRFEDYNPKAG